MPSASPHDLMVCARTPDEIGQCSYYDEKEAADYNACDGTRGQFAVTALNSRAAELGPWRPGLPWAKLIWGGERCTELALYGVGGVLHARSVLVSDGEWILTNRVAVTD
jgi:hypothetical protein